ncbi:uncharacterized protein LOC129313727 [Prosopis cineraria]|uniref:uncharacterized protein LOC129313727 n=1 Tax=Prosopis cineraria TaxID=364024 RepID=UPI00240EE6B8|nr:uncharacterized protein LOC129313727 [Prosopis cineraria]
MASLSAARPANLMTLGFSSRALIPTINAVKLSTRVSSASSRLRFDGLTGSQISQKQVIVSATNSSSGSGNRKTSNEEGGKLSSGAEGPPLLTILAGALVFLFFCWLIGSILTWLISLIVNVASPK